MTAGYLVQNCWFFTAKNCWFYYTVYNKATPAFFNALYEFLDPNEEYIYDQYLECQIPKNNFIVILTFNDITCIPMPIRDRMEVIEYSNYSIQDKKIIISDYILPKLKEKFSIESIAINDDALELYTNDYDILPGMRNAERDFEFILMKIAKVNDGKFSGEVRIDKSLIQETLGEKRTIGLNDIPPLSLGKCGMAQALAVTSSGIGVSTAVETVINPYQEKNVVVTGQLEGSCLESVSLACCYASKYLKKELPKLHIHMTDAVKKDGPSAGITITMSVLSCLLEKPLPNVAFTGSIDLYGNIGPVGGVFEKCIAAERTSVDKLFNEEDFRMALEVFGEYRTFFSKYKLPTSAQWNYLDTLYFADKEKGYRFNKAVYKRLQDAEDDGSLGMAYLKYEDYRRRWSEWLGLKKILPADEIRNLVRSLEEVEYSIPDYEIQDGFAYYRKEYEKYSFSSEDEEFIVSPPIDTRDFAAEAFRQNNCLWDNYFEDYLSGYSIILFIRKKDSPSVPYVTMEINSEEILQVYGKNNAFPDAYVYRFLEKYAKKMKLAYDPEELTSDGPGKWISKDKECECRAYFQELKFRSIHEAASTNGRYSASECKGQLSIYDCFDFLVADAR